MQKPAREDLGSKLQANINFRISVGRLDEISYDLTFGEVNKNKEFKYVKFVGGKRVYGRGYASVYGEVAREFYSPLLEKKFSFYDEYEKIERRDNPFNPLENPDAVLSEEEKENLQAEMEAQEELQKGEVKKASPELIQELMSSKQKESGNDLVRTFAFSKEIGVSAGSMKNLVDKLDGIVEFEKEDNVVYLNEIQRNIIKDLFELKQNTTQNWSEILEDFPFDEYGSS